MSDFGPVGVEALTLAWQEWLAWSWVLLPPVGFALVALVVRLRVAARARFRLTDGVEGRWHDGSECLAGWFEVEGSEASEPVGVARYGRLAKSHAALPPPVFSRPVVFRTADGRSVAFPAGAALTFQSQKDERHGHHVHVGSQEAEPATTTPGRRDVLHVHEIVVTPGQPVWLRGPAPLCGPWDYRSAPQPELDKLTVIFTAPSPPRRGSKAPTCSSGSPPSWRCSSRSRTRRALCSWGSTPCVSWQPSSLFMRRRISPGLTRRDRSPGRP